ncbi:hypothetical protein FB645_004209 [Coemansia sp. IMI 203386]|nr:hypothetical protein FB645_004209 [Coemansia sp. IMI 203386]
MFRLKYSSNRYSQYEQQQQQQHFEDSNWEFRTNGSNNGKVKLLRPTIWAVAFSVGTFYICSNMAASNRQHVEKRSLGLFDIFGLGSGQGDEEERAWALMADSHVQRLVGRAHSVAGEAHAKAIRRIAYLPSWVPFEMKRTMVIAADKWYSLSRGERCVYAIAGINAVVFGMWQIPRLLPIMARSFLHDPRSGLSYTMLTSTFSHREIWHFLFNSIALVSFGTSLADIMGPEHFTAFYLSAGVFSSLASHLLSPLRPALILPSLGASGAVYAVVGSVMMLFPHSKIALIFLPFLPMTISQAFPALMAYDLAGAVLGWRSFNHVAHLGGGLFGIAYIEWFTGHWERLVKSTELRRAQKDN